MKDGKPEVVAYMWEHKGRHACVDRAYAEQLMDDGEQVAPLIRLSDHEAVVADLHKSIQRMIDQTTPLVPDPNDPKWSRRIQIDDLMAQVAELKSLLDEISDAAPANALTREQAERIDAALSK